MNLPKDFADKMKALLGDEYNSYVASFDAPRLYGLRVNTNKISVEDFLKITPFDLIPIPWIDNGFYYDGEKLSPAKHPYYYAGLYYLQEPSAMTPANRLEVKPGEYVLDLCAAPGGKATELGSKLQGQGVLVANDISHSRAKALLKNLELFGIENIYVTSEEPKKLHQHFPEYFHKILVDAPCSGEGMFRKDVKMMKSWEQQGPEYYAPIQKEILSYAVEMLRPGGDIMYSTCTFDPMENEAVIQYILDEYDDLELNVIAPYEGFESGEKGMDRSVRIWPFKMNGEGHFLTLLHKKEQKDEECVCLELPNKKKTKKIDEKLEDFLKQVKKPYDLADMEQIDDKIYVLPKGTSRKKKLRYLRTGLELGTITKYGFEPSQAFAVALKPEEYKQSIVFPIEDPRVIKYLKGETIDVEDKVDTNKGWFLICVEGYSLGWGKVSNCMLKNKYEPGWRWQS